MKDFTNIYIIIEKLKAIETSSELEDAIIQNLISSYLINIHNEKMKETNYTIMNYSAEEVSNIMNNLNGKIGK